MTTIIMLHYALMFSFVLDQDRLTTLWVDKELAKPGSWDVPVSLPLFPEQTDE